MPNMKKPMRKAKTKKPMQKVKPMKKKSSY